MLWRKRSRKSIEKIVEELIRLVREGPLLILCHHNADPDAVCSALALQKGLQKKEKKARITVGVAESISRVSEQVLGKQKKKIKINPDITQYPALLILDTSTPNQLGPAAQVFPQYKGKKILLDHHAKHPEMLSQVDLYLVDEEIAASAEIVYAILKHLQIKLTKEIGFLLLTGIVADTAHLRLVTNYTLQILGEIVATTHIDPQTAFRHLEVPMDMSQRMAHLKAAQRMKIHKIGDWVVATSQVSSHEASAAKSLVRIGADLAFVGAKKKEEARISGRATNEVIKKTGLHLGRDILPRAGKLIGGSGGGHDAAAGANGDEPEKITVALKECVKLAKNYLSD